MNKKKEIDRVRESAGHATVGSDEDGAIVQMKNIGDRLLIIKERAIYEVVMADSIDPERTNINLPATIQKIIIDQGTESEIASRTLLTALTLFRKEFVLNEIDCNRVINLSIDLLSEIYVLDKEISNYINIEQDLVNEYEKSQNTSFKLPSIVNLETKCNTIFQKADHIEQTIMEIVVTFYPNQGLTKQSHFPAFHIFLKAKYNDSDSFVKFIDKGLGFMQIIRELRNGFEHRLDYAKVFNFELQTDGSIIAPTIELTHKKIKLERTSLTEFLTVTKDNMLYIIELTFAHLASKNYKGIGLPHEIREIPIEKRKNKFVKYCFWSPMGEEGFYNQ